MAAATRKDISEWFDAGKKSGHHYMIVVCDSYDYEDYPVYTGSGRAFWDKYDYYSSGRAKMQSIMEVYNLKVDKKKQMAKQRNMNIPSR